MVVAWTVSALSDLDEIQEAIAQDSPIAAFQLVNSLIDRTNDLLGRHPHAGRAGRVTGTREFAVGKTPYIVVYRVNDRVQIVAVVQGAKDWPDVFS